MSSGKPAQKKVSNKPAMIYRKKILSKEKEGKVNSILFTLM